MTLTEVLVATLVLAVVVLGVLSFRYYTGKELARANTEMASARLALVLLETWRGMGGTTSYDPTSQISTVTWYISEGPVRPAGLSHLGSYATRSAAGQYYATLSYLRETAEEPVLLHVTVGRMLPGQRWNQDAATSLVTLTTYADSMGL